MKPSSIFRFLANHMRSASARGKSTVKSAVFYNTIGHVNSKNDDASHWLQSRESDRRFIDAIYRDIVTMCDIDERARVADYGCGTGVLVYNLKTEFPGISITGIDFSENKIARCREFYEFDPECFRQGSIFDAAEFTHDVIVATEVLEHLLDPKAAVSNLLSQLEVGGRLFLTVPDGRTDTFHGHIHFWSPESWSLFIHDAVDSRGTIKLGKLAGKNFSLITV